MDTFKRTLVKAVWWRCISMLITGLAVWFFTKDIQTAIKVGLACQAVKMALYIGYERVWNRIKWGQVSQTQKLQRAESDKERL